MGAEGRPDVYWYAYGIHDQIRIDLNAAQNDAERGRGRAVGVGREEGREENE